MATQDRVGRLFQQRTGNQKYFDVNPSFVLTARKREVIDASADVTLTTSQSGALVLLSNADTDITLPAIGVSDLGMTFEFLSTIASTGQSITAQSGDLLIGSLTVAVAGAADIDAFFPDGTDDLIISMNGSTTGGLIGSSIVVTAATTTRWSVTGTLRGSGVQVTPFS